MSDHHAHHHHSHAGAGGHHHHHHSHHPTGDGALKRMKGAMWLNLVFALFELIGGFYFNSVAIMSDALHDFGDAGALGLAIYLEKYSLKSSDNQYSYGYRRFSVLGAFVTGVILLIGSAFILVEAIPRLFNPEAPHAEGMIFMALFGVAVNGLAAYRVSKGESLNEKMLMWHMLEDLAGWVLVLVGGIAIKFTDIPEIDAGLAVILSLWIVYNVFRNLKSAASVFLMAAPHSGAIKEAEEIIRANEMVKDVHHLHLWSLDGQKHILTAHLVVDSNSDWQSMEKVKNEIKLNLLKLGITEATFEFEALGSVCADPEHR
ncbi:MAG: cation diffusion facilitator family transporter [Bdellovibrionia bacterium]